MFITDKLSTELNVNYMELFNKSNEYNHSENKKYREDVRLHRVFLDKEIDFLACFALEYLKEQGIDSFNGPEDALNKMKDLEDRLYE